MRVKMKIDGKIQVSEINSLEEEDKNTLIAYSGLETMMDYKIHLKYPTEIPAIMESVLKGGYVDLSMCETTEFPTDADTIEINIDKISINGK